MVAWIAGLVVGVLGAAVVFFLSYWLGRCPRCGSLRGPQGLSSHDVSAREYGVLWKCRACGHQWERRSLYEAP